MSRCFPYPPPGYTPSRASNEALIESIKLQKEREKARAERKKEKKREKKEKKKAKEEKAKQIKTGHLDHDVYRGFGHGKEEIPQKERKDDTEQLERSSITEEHEQPICSQNPSYSSDSTQNSGKRKRHVSPVNGSRVQGTGNILRIRLPSQKHIKYDIKDGEEQPIRLPSQNHGKLEIRGDEEQLCSTSGRTDVPAENNYNLRRAENDKSYPTSLAAELFVNDDPLRSDEKSTQPNSVERNNDNDTPYLEYVHTDPNSKRYRKLKRVADQYRDLIENWTPPSTMRETTDNDGEDWLSGRKNEVNRPEKMLRSNTEMTCSGSSALWPRAHYLPDANIYALPFAVPF